MITHLGAHLNFYCQPVFNFSRAVQSPPVMDFRYEIHWESYRNDIWIELNWRRGGGIRIGILLCYVNCIHSQRQSVSHSVSLCEFARETAFVSFTVLCQSVSQSVSPVCVPAQWRIKGDKSGHGSPSSLARVSGPSNEKTNTRYWFSPQPNVSRVVATTPVEKCLDFALCLPPYVCSLFVCLTICLLPRLSVCLCSCFQSACCCLSVFLLSVCLSFCLSVCMSVSGSLVSAESVSYLRWRDGLRHEMTWSCGGKVWKT